jgi:hypothetical protein
LRQATRRLRRRVISLQRCSPSTTPWQAVLCAVVPQRRHQISLRPAARIWWALSVIPPFVGRASRRSRPGSPNSSVCTYCRSSGGRGFGPAALAALERAAEQLGYEAVRVDCQRSNWPMYLAAGYHEIADYNSNPYADIWGEKRL